MVDGLVFLCDDSGCVRMAKYTDIRGVADVFVEYHGEEDSEDTSTGSDYEDEIAQLSDDEPENVITSRMKRSREMVELVLVPDATGVITQVIISLVKKHVSSQNRSTLGSQLYQILILVKC
jgi:hypothetical protein